MNAYKVTPKQKGFILSLLKGRDVPPEYTDAVMKQLAISEDPEEIGLSKQDASKVIDALLRAPKKDGTEQLPFHNDGAPRRDERTAITTPGVFEKDGEYFVVKFNQAKTRLYAKRMVELNTGERATEAGTRVPIDFVYAPGAIYKLEESDRMPFERAKELAVRYGRCISCGRYLKAAESVERGIGPICRKYFA